MRHRKQRGKLGRPTGHRKALYRNLTKGLVEHERIRTTEAKAKYLRPFVERLVTIAKDDNQHNRKRVFSTVGKKEVVKKLFEDIGPRMKDRPGGYIRVIRDNQRAGDGSWMAVIEFVDYQAPTKVTRVEEPVEAEA